MVEFPAGQDHDVQAAQITSTPDGTRVQLHFRDQETMQKFMRGLLHPVRMGGTE
jgi:hypothetical protein